MKIVINASYGGFGLSEEGHTKYAEIKGITFYPETKRYLTTYWLVPEEKRIKELEGNWMDHSEEVRKKFNKDYSEQVFYDKNLDRTDPVLIQVVEELGAIANGNYAKLKVVEVPEGVDWEIDEYDGYEHIAEKHRTWS